jgi:hypothetical protein
VLQLGCWHDTLEPLELSPLEYTNLPFGNAAGGEYDSSDSSPGCQPSSPVDGDCMFSVEELQRLRGEHGNAAVTATFLRWPRSASIGRTASTVSARATYRSLG